MFRTSMTCVLLMSALSTTAQAQAPAQASVPPPQGMTPPPPRARGPSLSLAVEAAQVAHATCMANGYKTTILIVDSAGVPVVLLSGDGVGEMTQRIAPTKTAAALRYNMSSGEVLNKSKTDSALAAETKADPKIGTLRQGALLLKVGNDTVGAMA